MFDKGAPRILLLLLVTGDLPPTSVWINYNTLLVDGIILIVIEISLIEC